MSSDVPVYNTSVEEILRNVVLPDSDPNKFRFGDRVMFSCRIVDRYHIFRRIILKVCPTDNSRSQTFLVRVNKVNEGLRNQLAISQVAYVMGRICQMSAPLPDHPEGVFVVAEKVSARPFPSGINSH